jgi:hypothetical protein
LKQGSVRSNRLASSVAARRSNRKTYVLYKTKNNLQLKQQDNFEILGCESHSSTMGNFAAAQQLFLPGCESGVSDRGKSAGLAVERMAARIIRRRFAEVIGP